VLAFCFGLSNCLGQGLSRRKYKRRQALNGTLPEVLKEALEPTLQTENFFARPSGRRLS
jgi:hypothetical protein